MFSPRKKTIYIHIIDVCAMIMLLIERFQNLEI